MPIIGATDIQPMNVLEQYAKGLEVGAAERALERQEVDRIKAAEQNRALNEMYARAMGPTGQVDVNALYGMLARGGMGTAIPGIQAQRADVAFKEAQARKQLSEVEAAQFKNQRDLLATVTDQPGYDVWRANALKTYAGIPGVTELIPAQFSPETKQRLLMTADAALPKGEVRDVGGVLSTIDPYTGKEIGKVDYSAAEQAARAAGRSQFSFSPTTKLESAESTEKGKLNVQIYTGIRDSAVGARRLLPKLQTVRQKLDEGFKTGFFAPIKKEAAAFLSDIGVADAEKYATDAQTFFATAQERVLERQLEQKGVQTTSDAQRMTQTFAQLGNTPQANRFLVDIAEAQGKRDIETQRFYDKWWNENRTYEGAEEAWLFGTPEELKGQVSPELAKMAGRGSQSLFDDPLMKKYAPPADASVTVNVPGRGSVTFPNKAAADAFKKAAGIK
jgi:hypothetical protein